MMQNIFRKNFRVVLLLIAFLLYGQSFGYASKQLNDLRVSRSRFGGTLVMGTVNPPDSLNPFLTKNTVSAQLVALMFDSLIRVDAQGQIVPALAERWDISPDGLEYTFYLRSDVVFHDGTPFTAEDVLFTYGLSQIPDTSEGWGINADFIQEWEKINNHVVRVSLKYPYPSFLFVLRKEILPAHLLKNQDTRNHSSDFLPVGTGPFKFKSWDKQKNVIVLVAHEQYFEGRPFLDRIEVRSYENISQLWSAFMRQEIDLIHFMKPKDFFVLKEDETFRTYALPSPGWYGIQYALNNPFLRDLEIRQAIAMSIDSVMIMKEIFGGGIIAKGPFSPSGLGFDDSIEPILYDPEHAVEILNRLGWQDRNADGILEKEGQDFVFDLFVYEHLDADRHIALLIRQNLAAVGIKTQIVLGRHIEKIVQEGKINILRLFWGGHVSADPSLVVLPWYSKSIDFSRQHIYKNPLIDSLVEKAQKNHEKKFRKICIRR